MRNGYLFYIDGMLLPITPPSLKTTIGSQNKTVTLINEGEINLLKAPSLIEISFTARFPMRKYPYSREVKDFQTYFDKLKKLKEDKKPFQFIVVRDTVNGIPTWDTNLTVALETMTLNESHEYGDDVLIDIKLKQYKNFGVKTVKASGTYLKGDVPDKRPVQTVEQTTVKTKEEDNAYLLAKKTYGNGELWTEVVGANHNMLNPKKTLRSDVPRNSIYMADGVDVVLPDKTKISPSGTAMYGGIGGGSSLAVVHLKE